jgi:hypothetical protein
MRDHFNVVVKSAEDLVVTMNEHDGAQGEAHEEKREGLQAIEKAHVNSSGGKRIAYRRWRVDGRDYG